MAPAPLAPLGADGLAAMQAVMNAVVSLSTTPLGMLLLSLILFTGAFELLWAFVAQRRLR